MSSVPDSGSDPTCRLTGAETAVLRECAEKLCCASDASSIQDICAGAVQQLGIAGYLRWRKTHEIADSAAHAVDLATDPQGTRTLSLVTDQPLEAAHRENMTWLGRLATNRLRQQAETGRLYEAISRLALAERLQRALYAIAEQAASSHSMPEMMRALHNIVASLMYAENFFVVLQDPMTGAVRFPYYVDTLDQHPPGAEQDIPFEDIRYSLSWNLLEGGQPIMGSMQELKRQFHGRFKLIGPACEHCLAVPLRRNDRVAGGIVIQSYRTDTRYNQQDMELLGYVAQHVQTALERREAQSDLEHRVADRTAALRAANRVLRQQVLQRQRGEQLQAALFRIAELASTPENREDFYAAMHSVIGSLLYARNFYIALYDSKEQQITFPYSVDEIDTDRMPRKPGRGATEYVMRHGKPLLADRETFDRLAEDGECVQTGARSVCWLGVPLVWDNQVKGALVVQSYSPEHVYDERDQELLTFVGYHVANALQRKHIADSLKQAYAGLERRVTERTRALALANRDLREQIAERERVERRLKYETLHDSLTGLPNRTFLLQRMEHALQKYLKDSAALFAVLFIDLDRFKVINDSVGHLVGDDLLFQVGGRIRACLKTRDVVARLGGDEFAVLLGNVDSQATAVQVAERIISELQMPFRLGAKEVFTSASVGIAIAGPHYQRPEELLRDADSAMYRAKDAGRHCTAVFDDRLRYEALSLLEMEGDLRRGLNRREFVPFYQPVVTLEDGRTVGYEALLRWRHPERGLLTPGDFLAVAEESGSAESIDWQIFEQVCVHARSLASEQTFISFNVSGRHFRSPDLDRRLLDLFKAHQVSPSHLRIEVTEHTLLENPAQVRRILGNLRAHGVGIALDDFGTGYSSLSYLHQYPIQTLKIDRSFIVEMEHEGGIAVVRAIQVLADSLGMQVIAEGIEEEQQREALLQIGSRYGQGFLFSVPRAAEDWIGRALVAAS
ncbi:EAL domain-containing protein [Dyella sp. A6]|uniref:bifunctional diguanylate cyclase/phosphodiesterase n=1 Tax=Dyella aluminiiresistens TaxID=3069105 RepID=UPI002E76A201|nr:EAL domain-containing protein [Dyella sp. A6]